jgi:hypothetical protein
MWLGASRPTQFELVTLPVVVGEPSSGGELVYVVERVLGHGWVVALPAAVAGDDGPVATAAPSAGARLPARLDSESCRSRLRAVAARRATAFRSRWSAPAGIGAVVDAFYPFWLRYRRDRRGRIDFAALDGVTGQRAGGALRAALAAALVDFEEED